MVNGHARRTSCNIAVPVPTYSQTGTSSLGPGPAPDESVWSGEFPGAEQSDATLRPDQVNDVIIVII